MPPPFIPPLINSTIFRRLGDACREWVPGSEAASRGDTLFPLKSEQELDRSVQRWEISGNGRPPRPGYFDSRPSVFSNHPLCLLPTSDSRLTPVIHHAVHRRTALDTSSNSKRPLSSAAIPVARRCGASRAKRCQGRSRAQGAQREPCAVHAVSSHPKVSSLELAAMSEPIPAASDPILSPDDDTDDLIVPGQNE